MALDGRVQSAPLKIGLAMAYHRAQDRKIGAFLWGQQRPIAKPHNDDDKDNQDG